MILHCFFPIDDISAVPILSLTNIHSFSAIGLNSNNCIWSDKNGVLVHNKFESQYEAQNIVN
jgi:hypothetical protein